MRTKRFSCLITFPFSFDSLLCFIGRKLNYSLNTPVCCWSVERSFDGSWKNPGHLLKSIRHPKSISNQNTFWLMLKCLWTATINTSNNTVSTITDLKVLRQSIYRKHSFPKKVHKKTVIYVTWQFYLTSSRNVGFSFVLAAATFMDLVYQSKCIKFAPWLHYVSKWQKFVQLYFMTHTSEIGVFFVT